jgi:hypothetical protein
MLLRRVAVGHVRRSNAGQRPVTSGPHAYYSLGEYRRAIDARLVEASPAVPSFTFQRERPAGDWASIGLGVSALLPNGLQPFVQFATIQGNENFVSYGGTAGVRLGL